MPEAPDERPSDDERVVVEHEAARRGGEARERVQEGDHDRHVRAADGQHEQDAEEKREHEQQDHPDARLGGRGEDREGER